tara:strand:+ start:564 stop:1799 length:1236 start_codon:yes stop_codon:yes gene_type:complete
MSNSLHSEIVQAEGHLVDSQLLNSIFDRVIERGGQFEVLEFDIGRDNEAFSKLTLKVSAPTQNELAELLETLVPLGCHSQPDRPVTLREAVQSGCVPEDFYSTTNHRTEVKLDREWIRVNDQRMDAVIVVDGSDARCTKLRDVISGDKIVCGVDGVRVSPEFQERDRLGFGFMMNDVSSERRVEVSVKKIINTMREVRANNGRIAFVAGPVVIHSGGGPHFAELIKSGFVDVLLAGNALAVHDVERALYGTSLGIDLDAGSAVEEGHKNHMRAINAINRAGGLRSAVDQGVLKSGVMYEAIRHDVEYVLAGSIRDDGPLADTVMDLIDAQNQYANALEGVQMVIMLSTMLHSIGVGNMLPSWVKVVCVDINPAVVTKLADRGSSQTAGIVTDVGLFLHQLRMQLAALQGQS